MTLGEIIRNYRTEHSMSMDAFAERSGMSKQYISILEKNRHPKTGKPVIPSITMISKAAAGMSMDFDDLFSMIDGDVRIDPRQGRPVAESTTITPDEADLLSVYRDASEELKDAAFRVLGSERQERSSRSQNAG